ncbi:hypothetical protein [Oceanobacter kriegii]|uniref:hypothetical protein n=1 Tax=Oceanobacter kriegii TaxID=64972 RepID=UPI0006849C00|nr:hypothetical protein [Oceanobacter kriegii]
MRKYVVIIFLASFLTYLCKDVAIHLKYSDHSAVLDSLMNISAIIFAIVGAWIAIIYPKSLVRAFSPDPSNPEDVQNDTRYLGDLVEIVLASSFVLLSILIIKIGFPFVRVIHNSPTSNLLHVAGVFTTLLLSILQIVSIGSVVMANFKFLGSLREAQERKAFNDEFRRNNEGE